MALAGSPEGRWPLAGSRRGRRRAAALYGQKYAEWGYLPEIMVLEVAVIQPNTSCESW
jgi:hypothetical protein